MKKILLLMLCLSMLCLGTAALAEGVILNAEVLPAGSSVTSVTIADPELKLTDVKAAFSFDLTVTRGRGPDATTEIVPQPIYRTEWAPDGSVTLITDNFSPSAKFTITYAIPGTEEAETQVLCTWTEENSAVKYAIVDDFLQDTYVGIAKDAEGHDVEVKVVYRLFVPKNAENVPLVVTMHGSGESGDNGLAHVTSNQISTCWADPVWQKDHPCIVFAPQWPDSDMSNNLELRDGYLSVYHDMISEIIAKYNPSKTYLATLSMGSRLGFRYLTLYPEAFDAALMLCSALQNADLSTLTDKPIWLVHAVDDFVNAAQNSVDAYNQLVAAGNPNVRLTLVTSEGMHGVFAHAVWQQVFSDTAYMEWLFAQ